MTTPYDFSLPLIPAAESSRDSKDRLIDALQAQLREAREEIAERGVRLAVTEAKLDESRRALYECMGFRS